ncbi:hypothetical protein ACS0TY_027771 [Phlomoides rotata]
MRLQSSSSYSSLPRNHHIPLTAPALQLRSHRKMDVNNQDLDALKRTSYKTVEMSQRNHPIGKGGSRK